MGINCMECMVSFIIPVYNCRKYLLSCIDSIIESCRGSMMSAEIILVDDGSKDGSGELCDRLAERTVMSDSSQDASACVHFKVIHQRNQGVSSARNAGIGSAGGKYIVFIDSDDTVDPPEMANCMRAIAADPDIDMLIFGMSFDYYYLDRFYRSDSALPPFSGCMTKEELLENINVAFDANCLSSLCNKVYRRSLLTDLSLRKEMILYEDLEFSLRILSRCEKFLFIPSPVYHYRHDGNERWSDRLKRIQDIRSVIDRIDNALDEIAVDKEHILCAIGNILFFSKMKEMSLKQMKITAQQYKEWADSGGFREIDPLLYSGNVIRIKLKMIYSKYRHRMASVYRRVIYRPKHS